MTQMEEKLEDTTNTLDKVRKEADQWVEHLMAACTWVEQVEDKVLGLHKELQVAVGQAAQAERAPGVSQVLLSPLTLNTVPVQTHRGVNLADLLQRQLPVHGASLKDPYRNLLTNCKALEQAHHASELMAKDGLTLPAGSTVKAAKVQSHGDVIFTFSNATAA